MTYLPRSLPPAVGLVGLLVAALVGGCSPKKTGSVARDPDGTPVREGEAGILPALDGHPDSETIKGAVQRLDGLESVKARPVWPDADRAELTGLFRLTEAEAADLGQRTFSPTDVAYLEECLTIRTGLRPLNLDRRPPQERGALAFEWVCRVAFLDPRVPTAAPPWATLQGGCGVALSRSYAVLAAWRQVGVDGCLVGPPALRDAPSVVLSTLGPQGAGTYAPVRACGLKVGADTFLFDPAAGRPVPAADGKGILTLAAARANPAAAKALGDEAEVKTWQTFLAPPLPALSMRMEWLEQLNPGSVNVKLFADVRAETARFKAAGGETPGVWNPVGDRFSAPRITAHYVAEDPAAPPELKTLRDRHRFGLVPFELLPPLKLDEAARGFVVDAFKRWYDRFGFAPGSPRDLYVRGNLKDALSALNEIDREITAVKARIAQDKSLRQDFTTYFDEIARLQAAMNRARAAGNAADAQAAEQQLQVFYNLPKSRDIERAFTLGTAARPMNAEVLYLIAACVHERAERSRLDGGADDGGGWRNAAECWDRFLSEAPAVRKAFPGRERHAKAMRARCQSFLPK